MATDNGNILERGSRLKKLLAISATAIIASVALATPAWAAPVAPQNGHSITVFHNRDFVGIENYEVGQQLNVEVWRNGHLIGQASGPTREVEPGLVGLEVNHGPAGTPEPGDCWVGVTPNISPGDQVLVKSAAFPDGEEVVTANVDFLTGPTRNAAGDVVLTGTALAPDGTTPLSLVSADLEVRNKEPVFRANPTNVVVDQAGVFTATYSASRFTAAQLNMIENPDLGHSVSQIDAAETVGTISELGENGGPAPGCDAPRSDNAVTAFDDTFVNIGSGDLRIDGTAIASTSSVSVSINDEDPATPAISANVAAGDLSAAGPAGKTWTVNVPRDDLNSTNDLASLSDGRLTVSGAYTDGGLTGATKTIQKDTVAPGNATATPPGGVYATNQSVTLESPENNAKVRFTTNGSDPSSTNGQDYNGQIQVTGDQTIKAIVVDAAGNPSGIATFDYQIVAPDTTPPVAPDIDLEAASDSGISNSDNRTNVTTPTFTGTTEAGANVRLLIDGANRGSATADANGNYSVTANAPLTHGVKRVVAQATDAAGNSARSTVLSVNVDLVGPTVTVEKPAANALRVGVAANVTAKFSEPVTGVRAATFQLKQGTTRIPAVVSYNAGTRLATLNPKANLAKGKKYAAALTPGVKDSAGNSLTRTVWRFTTIR